MYGYGHGMFFGGWFMWLILIVVICIVVYAVFGRNSGSGNGSVAETPEDILKKRFARGEITEEEYKKMKDALRQ